MWQWLYIFVSVVYLLNLTSNHNHRKTATNHVLVVYLLNPTSNHNKGRGHHHRASVVYLLNPTSNHNSLRATKQTSWLYIFWILHQTTTCCHIIGNFAGCISFESYIKPQHAGGWQSWLLVVYLLNPTSNHNLSAWLVCIRMLYIFWILHQTTTVGLDMFLIPLLYIFWILHQTTTVSYNSISFPCCISFESYIKPQPALQRYKEIQVVYLLNPTSNHNLISMFVQDNKLYIFWILHQTTTALVLLSTPTPLYTFWILHQTTTLRPLLLLEVRCISFESYIKPQRDFFGNRYNERCISFESYIKPQPVGLI